MKQGYLNSKGTAGAWLACEFKATAQQTCELSRDRQAQSGPAVAPAVSTVDLIERIENAVQLLLLNTYTCVGYRKGDGIGIGGPNAQRYAAALGEFDRVRKQIAQDLLKTMTVGIQRNRRARVDDQLNIDLLLLRQRAKLFGQRQ